MIDRIKYEIMHRLWVLWHIRLRNSFNWADARLRGKVPADWMYGVRYAPACRPAWHMCCNGDAGGWRTKLCSWLEDGWRSTKHERRD